LKLLKRGKGSIVLGVQTSNDEAGETSVGAPFFKDGVVKTVWRNNRESSQKNVE
jgi:hypothetical protein